MSIMKLPKMFRNKMVRMRVSPIDIIPFMSLTIEKKRPLPKNWWKTKSGWLKEMFD